jgi:uncharacterized protein (TIGR03067 family)
MNSNSRLALTIALCLTAAVWLAATSSLGVADDAAPEAVKQELQRFEGAWQIVSLTIDGNNSAEQDAAGVAITFDGEGKLTAEADGNVVVRAKITVDPARKPKSIDLLTIEGENKDKVSMGIYEFDDNTHRVCYAAPTADRPTEFSSTPGSGHILAVFKRVKQ